MADRASGADGIAMKGGGYYSLATVGAKHVIDGAQPLVLDALTRLAPERGSGTFTMADFGCAEALAGTASVTNARIGATNRLLTRTSLNAGGGPRTRLPDRQRTRRRTTRVGAREWSRRDEHALGGSSEARREGPETRARSRDAQHGARDPQEERDDAGDNSRDGNRPPAAVAEHAADPARMA